MKYSLKPRYAILLLLIALLLNLPTPAKGDESPDTAVLQKVIGKIHSTYEKIDDLEADFLQTVEIYDFNVPYVSKGKLFIKKGKMLWDYHEPGKQMIYVNNGGFLFYVPDHKQVIRSKVGGHSDSHLPLKLLSGVGHLDQDFEVSFEIEPPKPGETIHLNLVPKKAMGLTNIVITVVPSPKIEGLIIDQVVLYEKNGNISTSTFNAIKINKGLDDALFEFEVPDGVEVLDAP